MGERAAANSARAALVDVYDEAVPYVYGYLLRRGGSREVAEELTATTFLAAVDSVGRDDTALVSVPWLIGIARHKLVDHWRRREREERNLHAVAAEHTDRTDPWDAHLDALRARTTLDHLSVQHRAALTLRYVDDLPVPQVARVLDRTVHATEALLVRARAAFRSAYDREDGDHD